MKLTKALAATVLVFLGFSLCSAQAQYNYTTNNNTITITKYTGSGGAVTVPDTINGLPVTSIGQGAFSSCTSLTSVTIGNSVTSIGDLAFDSCYSMTSITIPDSVITIAKGAFSTCYSLTSVYFKGNAPTIYDVFANNKVTVYYLAGTTGWSPTFGICPTKLWNLHPTALEIKVKTVQVTMHLTPTKKYQLQSSFDLTTWTNVGDPFVASTSELDQEFNAIEVGRYFQLSEIQ